MAFQDYVLKSHPTGSRYICNPAPTDTDNDTVFLVNGYYDWRQELLNEGWEDCAGKDYVGETFSAFRKGEENYIVTEDPDFYLSYLKATEGARALNLLNKEDRIKLFHTIEATTIDGLHGQAPFRDVVPAYDQLVFNQVFVNEQRARPVIFPENVPAEERERNNPWWRRIPF